MLYDLDMLNPVDIPKRIGFAKRFRKKCVGVMGRSPRHHKHLRKPEAKGYISVLTFEQRGDLIVRLFGGGAVRQVGLPSITIMGLCDF